MAGRDAEEKCRKLPAPRLPGPCTCGCRVGVPTSSAYSAQVAKFEHTLPGQASGGQ